MFLYSDMVTFTKATSTQVKLICDDAKASSSKSVLFGCRLLSPPLGLLIDLEYRRII